VPESAYRVIGYSKGRKPVPIEHLAPDAHPERVAEILARDGCCVVDRVASPDTLASLQAELEPWCEATAYGSDGFSGRRTRRTGGLIARSPTARELVQHPLVLGAVKGILEGATNFQIHLTQVISIGPGEPAQLVHRDQWAFDFFPFPRGYEVQCNTLWAVTDFTGRNGATRVIPGSHRLDDGLRFDEKDTEPAEMLAGSILLYTGALYHGAGANRSDETRTGLNLTYARAWLRQEENQYLAVPHETARELPEPLLRLMGYARGAYALGYVDDLRDPLDALRDRAGATGLGDLAAANQRAAGGRKPSG
jgi:ectoine hydroxylase-related dioxygenase (phytanoyl-CoA dioxygenase family)